LIQKLAEVFKKPFVVWICIGVGLLFLLFINFTADIQSPILLSLGRLHPLVLHFPIVLLGLLFLIELVRLYGNVDIDFKYLFFGFIIALISIVISIKTGFLLFSSGEYSGMLMDMHYRNALITGALSFSSFGLFLKYSQTSKFYSLYILSLLAANSTLIFTGHQGASITHGKDYLTAYLPLITARSEQKSADDSISYFFKDVIQPTLEFKCGGCHNPTRPKGGLSVTNYADLFKEAESGNAGIAKEDTFKSEIYRRIMLPDTAKDHMPPAGKINMTRDEIALVKFWIQSGAYENLRTDHITYAPLKDRISQMRPALQKYKLNLEKEKYTQAQIHQDLLFQAKELEVEIKKDESEENNLYTLSNTFPPAPFDSRKLKELKPYLDRFSKVSLVSSQIDDADLYLIGQMENVKELYLQKTKIKGFGLLYLARLPHLEILNVSFTDVDDKTLIDLLKFPALKEIYLYGTKTTRDVIQAVEKHKPGLKVYSEEGPYF
jgi:uncharacterized membrane protein